MSVAFRLACCLCGKPIPLSQDVYALDAEWQRRYPAMRGVLAGQDCALPTTWTCAMVRDAQGARTYAPEHIPAQNRSDDFDAWSHVLGQGTHIGMVQVYPRSALLQGAEPYLRNSTQRQRTAPAVVTRLRALLQEWDACATDERLERFGRFPVPVRTAPSPAGRAHLAPTRRRWRPTAGRLGPCPVLIFRPTMRR